MIALMPELTEKVSIFHDDGSVVECRMTPALARSIEEMDAAEREREKKYRAKHRTATDLKSNANLWDSRRKTSKARPTGRPWQGPRFTFRLLLGESAIWDGPASLWLTREGKPCRPGEEPIVDDDGRRVGRSKGQRCRLCGHFAHGLPEYAMCLNDACSRTGRDREIRKDPPRAKPKAPPVDAVLTGGRGPSHASPHGKAPLAGRIRATAGSRGTR